MSNKIQEKSTPAQLPKLSHTQLEKKAIQFREENNACPDLFQKLLLDCDQLLAHLTKTHGLNYKITNLGYQDNKNRTSKILGVMIGKENAIYIDECLENNPHMKRFTQAHELGHWVLHRELELSQFNDSELTLNQHQIPTWP